MLRTQPLVSVYTLSLCRARHALHTGSVYSGLFVLSGEELEQACSWLRVGNGATVDSAPLKVRRGEGGGEGSKGRGRRGRRGARWGKAEGKGRGDGRGKGERGVACSPGRASYHLLALQFGDAERDAGHGVAAEQLDQLARGGEARVALDGGQLQILGENEVTV